MVCVSDSGNPQQRRALLFFEATERQSEDQRKDSHLQNLIVSNRLGQIFRKDVQQKLLP